MVILKRKYRDSDLKNQETGCQRDKVKRRHTENQPQKRWKSDSGEGLLRSFRLTGAG